MQTKNLKECDLLIDQGYITVQSCNEEIANVGVFVRQASYPLGYTSAYHRLSVPSLEREWCEIKPYDLRPEEYDRLIDANRTALLDLIAYLHRAIPPVK